MLTRWAKEHQWPPKPHKGHTCMRYIQDTKPHPLNHVCCRGVTARARSIHLMTGSHAEGQNTPKTMPSCSSRSDTHSHKNLTDHRKPTRSPQTSPITQYSLASIKMHTKTLTSAFPPHHYTTTPPTFVEQNHLHTITRPSSSQTLHVIAPGSSSALIS